VPKSSQDQQGQFGNWLSSAPMTIFGLPPLGLIIAGGAVVVALGCVITGFWLNGLLVIFGAGVALLFFVVRFGDLEAGRTIASRVMDVLSTKSRQVRGESIYATGVLSSLPVESLTALPGALVDMDEIDGVDGTGQDYTLLHHKTAGVLAATFSCSPDGTALQPQATINQQVSQYGGWIASLSKDEAIVGATVIVDSELSDSAPLVEKIHSEVSATAPSVAQAALREGAALLPAKYSSVESFATIAWSKSRLQGDIHEAAADVAARLPAQRDALYASGAGICEVATSEDLAREVLVSYQPRRAAEFGSDDLTDHAWLTRLGDAGPEFFDDNNGRVVFHDGVASMTVMMTVPPRMHITERTMEILFAPADRFLRKRVAVFYRPLSGAQAVKTAEKLRRNSGFMATSGNGEASAFDTHKVTVSGKAEAELVKGASMTRFMMMVTVTFEPTHKAHRDAENSIKSLMDQCGLKYRFVEHGGSAAFHSTLPLGIMPWMYRGGFALFMEGRA
jgi:hypothetical protein